jgi:hypothetical protein
MALEKEYMFPNGAVATYWVAQPVIDNLRTKSIRVVMYGYASKQIRDDVKKEVGKLQVYGQIEKVNPTWQEIYDFVKEEKYTQEPQGEIVDIGEEFVPVKLLNIFEDAVDLLD